LIAGGGVAGLEALHGERLDVQRLFAVPRVVGPALDGVPCDDEGFIVIGDDTRVQGAERVWAAGDGVVSPTKFGGVATHQARRAAAAIARPAGTEDAPDPGDPASASLGRRMREARRR
jgi:sulfide:quinone oxidoreductase